MNKKFSKRTVAAIFYVLAGLLMALIIFYTVQTDFYMDLGRCGLPFVMAVLLFLSATVFMVTSVKAEAEKVKIMRTVLVVLFLTYLLILIWFLFMGGVVNRVHHYQVLFLMDNWKVHFDENTNFLPFKMISNYIRGWRNHNVSLLTLMENLLGNLLLFAPMGLFLPCIFKKMNKFWKYLLSILFLSIAIESFQLITGSGKCDIDDLILNLAGAVAFYGFFRIPPIKKLLQKVHVQERTAVAKKRGEA